MEILKSVTEMRDWSKSRGGRGLSIGFVPTMGYLHEGHLSLMGQAREENDSVVVSIFVNPAQFGRHEDYGSYPRDPQSDAAKCIEAGVHALFMPEPEEMYRSDYQTFVEVQNLSVPLCGRSRPGHFRGVATVVLKLFNIVRPTASYFGSKDYQQLQVIKRMVSDLDLEIRVVACPTVREKDGLAMSSRNAYLSKTERVQATCLYEALLAARRLFASGEREGARYVESMTGKILREPDVRADYVNLVHPDTLEDLSQVDDRCVAILAARIGRTRLIDNMLFNGRAFE